MAKKKLDNDMINGVSGGELGQASDGTWEVLDRNGRNVFANRRSFRDINAAARIATLIGENTTYLTPEEIARRQVVDGAFGFDNGDLDQPDCERND